MVVILHLTFALSCLHLTLVFPCYCFREYKADEFIFATNKPTQRRRKDVLKTSYFWSQRRYIGLK